MCINSPINPFFTTSSEPLRTCFVVKVIRQWKVHILDGTSKDNGIGGRSCVKQRFRIVFLWSRIRCSLHGRRSSAISQIVILRPEPEIPPARFRVPWGNGRGSPIMRWSVIKPFSSPQIRRNSTVPGQITVLQRHPSTWYYNKEW